MLAPVLSWWNFTNSAEFKDNIDLGSVSPGGTKKIDLILWNNRGGTIDVSDAQIALRITDDAGNPVTDMETNGWFKIKFYRDNGATSTVDFTSGMLVKAYSSTLTDGYLSGRKNSGMLVMTANDVYDPQNNFCKITLYITPPGVASVSNPDTTTRIVLHADVLN